MVMYGRWGLLMFFEPFCKSSCRFSYVFFFTPIFTTFISVYDPNFVGNRICVLGAMSFLQHLNSIHNNIKFTCEEVRDDGSMPFLDILITPKEDGSLSTSVFRKPTHTDLYLQWDSHHTISSKYSVAGTLYHRAKTICSDPQLQKKEDHLCQALQKCRYPIWAINRARIKNQNPSRNKNRNNNNQTGQKTNINKNIYMVVPYQQGPSERVKNTCQKYGIQVHFKGGQTIKDLLMTPRTKSLLPTKLGSYTDINVVKMGVKKNT